MPHPRRLPPPRLAQGAAMQRDVLCTEVDARGVHQEPQVEIFVNRRHSVAHHGDEKILRWWQQERIDVHAPRNGVESFELRHVGTKGSNNRLKVRAFEEGQ